EGLLVPAQHEHAAAVHHVAQGAEPLPIRVLKQLAAPQGQPLDRQEPIHRGPLRPPLVRRAGGGPPRVMWHVRQLPVSIVEAAAYAPLPAPRGICPPPPVRAAARPIRTRLPSPPRQHQRLM